MATEHLISTDTLQQMYKDESANALISGAVEARAMAALYKELIQARRLVANLEALRAKSPKCGCAFCTTVDRGGEE